MWWKCQRLSLFWRSSGNVKVYQAELTEVVLFSKYDVTDMNCLCGISHLSYVNLHSSLSAVFKQHSYIRWCLTWEIFVFFKRSCLIWTYKYFVLWKQQMWMKHFKFCWCFFDRKPNHSENVLLSRPSKFFATSVCS